jgi:cbb3-type cytochrome oxidase subunit 3
MTTIEEQLADADRRETPTERADRNLNELLSELRVALPGVQVIFAFLLAVPFQQRFGRICQFDRTLYFITLLTTALSSMLLIAPSVHHRLLFRRHRKAELVEAANRLTIAGLAVLALAMTCAIVLITNVLFGAVTSIVTTVIVVLCYGVIWWVLPLRSRRSPIVQRGSKKPV